MKTTLYIILAGAIYPAFAFGQQAPMPQQPAINTPCKSAAPSQPHKEGWLEKKARAIACKKNANLCSLPDSTDDALGTQAAKPCVQSPPPKTAIPANPSPVAKPALVCPPRTVLIAGTAYCLTADHTTVDAIVLPPNQQPQK